MNTDFLIQALSRLAGTPHEGDLLFTRALERSEIQKLLAGKVKWLNRWKLQGVGEAIDGGWITADRAVELREAKGPATVLLVDIHSAGAGMDGIYSAAREISEAELFGEAIRLAEQGLQPALRKFAQEAVRRAQRIGGRRQPISHWQEFAFYSALADSPEEAGRAVYWLGLWPLAGNPQEAMQLLPQSGLMVEKLLLPPMTSQAPAIRIASLVLEKPPQGALEALENLLRRAGGRSRLEVLEEAARNSLLWLGNLKPGFLTNKLVAIEIVPWRQSSGKLLKWSGLKQHGDEGLPQFVVDRQNPKGRLQVRWRIRPAHLPKGAATFEVRVLAGEEELASHSVELSGRTEEKAIFTAEDFEELDEAGRWEVCIEVSSPGAEGVEPQRTEDFLLLFGESPVSERVAAGEIVRAVVDGLIQSDQREVFEQVAEERAQGNQGQPDKHGFLSFRLPGSRKGFRVERPRLLAKIEEDWTRHRAQTPIGRWVVRCRPDGSWPAAPNYQPILQGKCPDAEWQRLVEAAQRFQTDISRSGGTLARFYLHGHSSANVVGDYLNAWQGALEQGPPNLALANTLEVQTLAGRTIGLVVLPFHPLRVAWQSAYDTLALHLRSSEGLPVQRVRKALQWLDGAHFPFVLPGLREGESFVFGDALGLAGVAMVSDADREPKAAIAMLAACYTGDSDQLAPVLSIGSGSALAREIRHYLDTHPHCEFLHVHAMRPGDGATVVRALGRALRKENAAGEGDFEEQTALRDVAVRLDLYPSESQLAVAGRHLVRLNQRRRAGSAAPPPEDAWCLESLELAGGRMVPRLRWARREPGNPQTPAHLALAFDTFCSRVQALEAPARAHPLLAFGLVAPLCREFAFEQGQPRWRLSIPTEQTGEKLPDRVVTERLTKLHVAVLEATARSLGQENAWPVQVTELGAEAAETLERLHRLCDWVVTMDRNVGIEYFDSPREAEAVFDAYVIDAVPERDDLGCLQLITSTAHFDEVRHLLDETLTLMGLSGSARNCKFLLDQLKALSGRLAMRLAAGAQGEAAARIGAELVALALARKKCLDAVENDPCWPSLRCGFFVPLDDVRDLVPGNGESDDPVGPEHGGGGRADFLYVSIPSGKGRLGFRFVEVKYRRHLALARAAELQEEIAEQTRATREAWTEWFFGRKVAQAERTLRAARLARVLRFYADKARRHHLDAEAHRRFNEELNKLLSAPAEYNLAEIEAGDRGLIFCPEFVRSGAERLGDGGSDTCAVWLFGPDTLPDRPPEMQPPISLTSPSNATGVVLDYTTSDATAGRTERGASEEPAPENGGDGPAQATLPTAEPLQVILGVNRANEAVVWSPTLRGNPHLMIVGLPGMGKTTCLVNLCRQLHAGGIAPIVFSYHDDIDEQFKKLFPKLACHDCRNLGFNPMRIIQPSRFAHVEAAGQLRDIFGAIFEELGELQLEHLRDAIKKSYTALGWGDSHPPEEVPAFRDFLIRLRNAPNPSVRIQSLLARLNELDDFGFFDATEGEASLLDSQLPRLICIHAVANEKVQRAYASFVLYRIYQDMFRRGRQERLTHAVVFDEAHRASRLKLLPTMAKECRKYGLALIVASQEARDFDRSLFAAIANYLVLRVTDADARAMARNVAAADQERRIVDWLKNLPRFTACFFTEGQRLPASVRLAQPG